MSDEPSDLVVEGSPRFPEPSVEGLEMGVYESDAGAGHVWVRRDVDGETVRARMSGYPPEFEFEPGDETGLEPVDGHWQTLPSVAHSVRLDTRIDWWTMNRRTGHFKFLASRHLT